MHLSVNAAIQKQISVIMSLCRLIHTMFYRRYNSLKTSELLNFYSDVRFSLFLEESF